MPQIMKTTVYTVNELSEPARQKARDWYRTNGFFYPWWDAVYDDFETICGLLGIELKQYAVKTYGGNTVLKPAIYFSGFSNQGDGACFEGRYCYAPKAVTKIKDAAPNDTKLHEIAEVLGIVQKRNFCQLTAEIGHHGRYFHEYSMDITVKRTKDNTVSSGTDGIICGLMRDLARWLYRRLQDEFDSLTSDCVIDEVLLANVLTFTKDGRHFIGEG